MQNVYNNVCAKYQNSDTNISANNKTIENNFSGAFLFVCLPQVISSRETESNTCFEVIWNDSGLCSYATKQINT